LEKAVTLDIGLGDGVLRVSQAPSSGIVVVASTVATVFAGISRHVKAVFAMAIRFEITVTFNIMLGTGVRRDRTAPLVRMLVARAMRSEFALADLGSRRSHQHGGGDSCERSEFHGDYLIFSCDGFLWRFFLF